MVHPHSATVCRYADIMSDPSYVDDVLAVGADRAAEVAHATLDGCKDAMGFVLPARRARA